MEYNELDMLKVIEESFGTYAGMTIQDRAIVDARDFLKPSQRMCMYSLLLNKYTYKKPFVKSQECVGKAMADFYVHGDASCYDLLVRLARPYNQRYPLMGFKGQFGPIKTGKPSAARYTDMRLGEIGCKLYEGINEDSVKIWFDNYSNTKQFPSVVPSLGFYNIVNGTSGIATSLSSSVPQFNLKEVNEAMIKLLWNPDISFDEIYCAPDFCTAGTILNADAVKEILRYGGGEAVKGMKFNGKKLGSSVRMRATAEYDSKENAIYFTEVPYGVYTHTIVEQIVKGINDGTIVGIAKDGIKDLSKNTSNIKIVLEKGANPSRLIKTLFKQTDLDSSYTINMVMLDNGTYPRLFSWKEALQAHLDHEVEMRTNIHQYHLVKIENRLHIIDGLLIAIANINEVVELIRSSNDKAESKKKLSDRFKFDDAQCDAILKMTLSKLMHLEIGSFNDEKTKLLAEKTDHEAVLNSKELLYKEIEKDLRTVANQYGDARRTRLTNFDFTSEEEDAEPIEKKELLIYYTNFGNLYTFESSTLVRTRRGGKGSKIKLSNGEVITKTIRDDNFSSLLIFTNKGEMYSLAVDELPVGSKININQLFEFKSGEVPTSITTYNKADECKYFIFVTKNGMVKKTLASEYKLRRGKVIKAINLQESDEVQSVHFANEERLGILTNNGNFVIINTNDIKAIGRTSMGVKGIKLSDGDYVIDSHLVKESDKYLISISKDGIIKKVNLSEFSVCNRNIKGKRISEIKDGDKVLKYLTINEDCDIIIVSKKKSIKISTSELRVLSRAAVGVKSSTLDNNDIIVDLQKEQW